MTSHADRAHAKTFSPSKADIWLSCTSQPAFKDSLGLTDTSSEAADLGTAAHELLEVALTTEMHPRKFKGKTFNDRFIADDRMINGVAICYEWVQTKVLQGYKLHAERRLIIAVTGEVGTTDITLWNPTTRHLIVGDYKNGSGYVVDPTKNRQMRLYACGTCDADRLWGKFDRLTLVIFQPNVAEEPQEWEDSPAGLENFRRKVGEIVDRIKAGKTEFAPSEKACRWCPAKAQCKSYATFAIAAAALDFEQVIGANGVATPSCQSLTLTEIVNIYRNMGTVYTFLKSVNSYLYSEALAGRTPPGLKLVETSADRKWRNEGDVMEALHRLGFKPDDYAPRSVVGLGAVETLLKSKKMKPAERSKVISSLTIKPDGRPTLADAEDPRPAYSKGDFPPLEAEL